MENDPVAPPVLAAWRVGSEAADDTWSITPVFELIGGMPGQSKVKLAALRDALAAREPAILTIGELKQNLTDAELTEVIKSENLGNRLKKQVGRFLSATESGYQWTAAHRGGKRVGGNGNNAVLFKVSDMGSPLRMSEFTFRPELLFDGVSAKSMVGDVNQRTMSATDLQRIKHNLWFVMKGTTKLGTYS